jgi:hypothetical protein
LKTDTTIDAAPGAGQSHSAPAGGTIVGVTTIIDRPGTLRDCRSKIQAVPVQSFLNGSISATRR